MIPFTRFEKIMWGLASSLAWCGADPDVVGALMATYLLCADHAIGSVIPAGTVVE